MIGPWKGIQGKPEMSTGLSQNWPILRGKCGDTGCLWRNEKLTKVSSKTGYCS